MPLARKAETAGKLMSPPSYDVIAFGAHPDDVEAVMGGTVVKLVEKGRSVVIVDLCDGEPTRQEPEVTEVSKRVGQLNFWVLTELRFPCRIE